MELHQLRTFAVVADTGHLTRAAERLHLSQPAVSAHIRALEQEFGTRLFERTASGMEITRPGRDLLQYAERVLAAADSLRNAASALIGRIAGHLRIGTVVDPELLRLGEFLGRALERHPGIELELRQEVSGAALEAVRTGTLDASFYFGEIDSPEVTGIRLTEIGYRVVAPVAWADRVRRADWQALAALPWILTPPISTVHRMVRRLFEQNGVEPVRIVEADNEQVIANLVAAGVGISVMREDLAAARKRAGEIVRLKKIHPRLTLWFISRTDRHGDPALAALLDVLRETWREDPIRQAPRGAPVVEPA